MVVEKSSYHRLDKCTLTGDKCGHGDSPDYDCRACLVPIYMMLLEERDKK